MGTLSEQLRARRDGLVERGAKAAGAVRELELDALRKIRGSAAGWRRTLLARKAALDGPRAGTGGLARLRARAIEGADRLLVRLLERAREEVKRLQSLELPRPAEPAPEVALDAASTSESVETSAVEPVVESANEPVELSASEPVQRKAKSTRKRSNEHRSATSARDPGTPKRLVLPIAGYESLSVREILAELPRLSAAQCRALVEFERAHKKRKTVLSALEPRVGS